jgi:hypothetical protein
MTRSPLLSGTGPFSSHHPTYQLLLPLTAP